MMARARKLLYVITTAELGGAQANLSTLARHFRKSWEILCVVGDAGRLVEELRQLNVRVHVLPGLGRRGHWIEHVTAPYRLVGIVRRYKPDIIHAHSSKAGLLSRLVGYCCRVPVIFTAHGWGFKPGVPMLRRLLVWCSEAFSAWLTAKVIVVSDYDLNLANRWIPNLRGKMVLVRNGIHSTPPTNKHAYPPIIVMVARFREPKRQDLLVAAVQLMRCSCEVWLVGDGPNMQRVKDQVRKAGLSDKIKFVGSNSSPELFLEKAGIYVLLSNYEGLPISIIEAMRAGLPIVASRVGGIPELVEDNVTGYLVENSVASVLEALQKLSSNAELRRKMGEAAREKFLLAFTDDQMIPKVEQIYLEVHQEA